jgi:CBS domain-containing protein
VADAMIEGGFAPGEGKTVAQQTYPKTHNKEGEGMQVREMMSTAIEVVDRNDHLQTVEERMAAKQLRHLPVLEQGEIVGMVTQRDLFKGAMSSTMGYGEKAQQAYLQSVRVKEIMVYPVVTVAPDISVAAAADMIINKGIGCLPVIEGTKLVGMVTKTDLLRCLRTLVAA